MKIYNCILLKSIMFFILGVILDILFIQDPSLDRLYFLILGNINIFFVVLFAEYRDGVK